MALLTDVKAVSQVRCCVCEGHEEEVLGQWTLIVVQLAATLWLAPL